jgi:hypothetical protein
VPTSTLARPWFALTAVTVLAGLVLQAVVTAGVTGGRYDSAGARVLNLLCFFTIQSNLLVGATSALLALRPDRPSTLFRTLRLDGVVAIAVTGVVFRVAIAPHQQLTGAAAVADFLLHTASPVLAVLGWLLFGPRSALTRRIVWLAVVFPVCWLGFTLVRGALVDFYPYTFLDVTELGYAAVVRACLLIAVLFLGLAAGAAALDRRLARRSAAVAAGRPIGAQGPAGPDGRVDA